MENELQTNLDEILLDKETNLLPENLKEGVTVLGVEGSLKVTGSDSNIKLFETVEDMNNDPNPKEDDLAVVYREELQPFKEDTETQFITFPEQVILDEPFTDNVYGMIEAVDSSVIFYGNVMFYGNMFEFQSHSETGMIQVRYESQDQITWTRTQFMNDDDTLTNPVDLGTIVKWQPMEPFNEVIGKFMLVGGNTFDGLYEYQEHNVNTKISYLDNIQYSNDTSSVTYDLIKYIDLSSYIDLINSFLTKWNMLQNQISIIVTNDGIIIYGAQSDTGNNSYTSLICTDTGMHYIGIASSLSDVENYVVHKVVIHSDSTFEEEDLSYKSIPNVAGICYVDTIDNTYGYTKMIFPDLTLLQTNILGIVNNTYFGSITTQPSYYRQFDYLIASTQLTLNNPSQLLPGVIAYGENGVITGDNSILTVDTSFSTPADMIYVSVKKQYDNMQPRVLTDSDKTIDKNIYFIPTNADGLLLLNTSSVTNMSYMFRNCINLQVIPLLDTSSATDMDYMFDNCTNLQTVSLLDTSSVTSMSGTFSNCTNLQTIPLLNTSKVTEMSSTFSNCTNLQTVPLLDTSSVTRMGGMFRGCSNLTSIPLLDTSSASNISGTFSNCPLLSDDSLNNILQMCINAVNISSKYKTLKYVGLSSEQATKCTTLSNWNACTTAGWTTGY